MKTPLVVLLIFIVFLLITCRKAEGLQVNVLSANMPDGIISLIDANDNETSQYATKSAELCSFKKEIKVGSETIKKCPVLKKEKCLVKECTIM